ncbi:hypothetical protein [Pseudooceanicola sp. MF1-13]|uniref:hypothetical protein n=1 Tax=Pseudooceanicola sp. MF1-13 TaxID=3379095 RepID=UPI003891B5B4
MTHLELSQKGQDLIKLYEDMAVNGYTRKSGAKVTNVYNDFELQKFRNVCKKVLSNDRIKTVLDYGGGGSNWDAPKFDPDSGLSAKEFFGIDSVTTFEPARNLMNKVPSDGVVCMDVLEHIYLSDVPNVVEELFTLAKHLLVVNVACYEAAALLPNGENAHITVRKPHWWKGVMDTIAVKYPEVDVMLICSETFSSGILFDTFKAADWQSADGFVRKEKVLTFGRS